MAQQLKRFRQVEKYFGDEEIIRDTASQILKDFSAIGFDLTLPHTMENPYQALFDALEPEIRRLIENNDPLLKGLLYRIDLPKNLIISHEQTRDDWSSAEALTDLIIRREMEKVVWRRWFSGN